jgi:hypothetical protein
MRVRRLYASLGYPHRLTAVFFRAQANQHSQKMQLSERPCIAGFSDSDSVPVPVQQSRISLAPWISGCFRMLFLQVYSPRCSRCLSQRANVRSVKLAALSPVAASHARAYNRRKRG